MVDPEPAQDVEKRRLLRALGPLVALALFAAALWVIRRELSAYHYHDILRELHALPAARLWLAVGLTLLNYVVMTGYDALALRYVRKPLGYPRIALASFLGYAFSNNIGLSMLAGSSVRYRLYSAWGLSTPEITKVVAFYTVSLWLGLFAIAGGVFLAEPTIIPAALHFPAFASTRPLGALLVLILVAYLAWSTTRRGPLKLGSWEVPIPSPQLSVAQLVVSSLDWALAGAVLYVLFPAGSGLKFPGFLAVFLLAQIAGLVSQVPGGLGVFETVVLLLIPAAVRADAAVGSLLAFRLIYYLLPLAAATGILAGHEIYLKKVQVRRIAGVFDRVANALAPRLLALAVFVGGAILLISGATPAVPARLEWLEDLIPLTFLEASHFLASVSGVALLLLARGLQRRLSTAYLMTAGLLAAGIVFSLLKGFDYEEAGVLAVMLAALLPSRRFFYRRASLIAQPFTGGWIAAIAIVLVGSTWLGLFAHRHIEFGSELWWQFALHGDASRFLRATVGVGIVAIFFAAARLLRPARPRAALDLRPEDLELATAIAAAGPDTSAYLVTLGDKAVLVNENRVAFLMYGIERRSWVAMGDPVGPPEERRELVWRFRDLVDRAGGWTVFYEVGPRDLPLYLDLGLTLLKLGESARVSLDAFSLEGGKRKDMRYVLRKLEKEGCAFAVAPPEDVPALLPELRAVSDSWLAEKKTREKGFSLGFFDEGYLRRFPHAIVRREGKIVAFANLWPGGGNEELSVDLMRHVPDAPKGVMEFLFLQLIMWGKEHGYRWFNLGMAPLSGFTDSALAPLWNRVGAFLYRHGDPFYGFQGLREYKEKFTPVWEPRYLACPGGLALPRILTDIASLISGGISGVIAK